MTLDMSLASLRSYIWRFPFEARHQLSEHIEFQVVAKAGNIDDSRVALSPSHGDLKDRRFWFSQVAQHYLQARIVRLERLVPIESAIQVPRN